MKLDNLHTDVAELHGRYDLIIDSVSPALQSDDIVYSTSEVDKAINAVAELESHLALAEEYLGIVFAMK